jgi:hypothetical protein
MQRSTKILIGITVASLAHGSLAAAARASRQPHERRPHLLAALPGPPSVATGPAAVLSPSTAMLSASVDTHGLETNAFFRYGTSPSYGAASSRQEIPAGLEGQRFQATLSGLRFATTYHYQAVAANASGEASGADGAFTTADAVVSGRYAVTLTVRHGGRPFGQGPGRNVRRPYRFTAHCEAGLCPWLRLRRRGAQGTFQSVLHRREGERYVGVERSGGRCDNGERFRATTRVVVSPTGESGGWATQLVGSLTVRVRGCLHAAEVARLTARRAEG